MPRLDWLKLHTEARNDRKLQTLSDREHRIWFNLLCFAADQSERGSFSMADPELLALEVADGDTEVLSAAIMKLVKLKILGADEEEENKISFLHFRERQYDKPSDVPEATRARKQQQRSRHVTPRNNDVTPVTPREEEKRVEKSRSEKTRESGAFAPMLPPEERSVVHEKLGDCWSADDLDLKIDHLMDWLKRAPKSKRWSPPYSRGIINSLLSEATGIRERRNRNGQHQATGRSTGSKDNRPGDAAYWQQQWDEQQRGVPP